MTGYESLCAAPVAALFVATSGAYFGNPEIDPWDEQRDARLYDGPHPVVAHPPCSRWCQLASVNEKRYGHKIGDDGGCFESALASVRRFGGVLEHPAYTLAWPAFGLPRPQRGSWQQALDDPGWAFGNPGWVTEVAQAAYGHPARKLTWLYYVGPEPPALDWRDSRGSAVIGGGINSGECVGRRKIEKREASATPAAFRDVLLNLARRQIHAAVADVGLAVGGIEAACDQGDSCRELLTRMIDPAWWREEVDVNGEYTTTRSRGYYEVVGEIKEALDG